MKTVVLCGITLLAVRPAFGSDQHAGGGESAEQHRDADRLRRRRLGVQADHVEQALIVPGTPQPGQPIRHRHRFRLLCLQPELNRRDPTLPPPTATPAPAATPSPVGTSGTKTPVPAPPARAAS